MLDSWSSCDFLEVPSSKGWVQLFELWWVQGLPAAWGGHIGDTVNLCPSFTEVLWLWKTLVSGHHMLPWYYIFFYRGQNKLPLGTVLLSNYLKETPLVDHVALIWLHEFELKALKSQSHGFWFWGWLWRNRCLVINVHFVCSDPKMEITSWKKRCWSCPCSSAAVINDITLAFESFQLSLNSLTQGSSRWQICLDFLLACLKACTFWSELSLTTSCFNWVNVLVKWKCQYRESRLLRQSYLVVGFFSCLDLGPWGTWLSSFLQVSLIFLSIIVSRLN